MGEGDSCVLEPPVTSLGVGAWARHKERRSSGRYMLTTDLKVCSAISNDGFSEKGVVICTTKCFLDFTNIAN